MRVLHVIDSLEHGGAEAVVVALANACSAEHEITICCLRGRGDLADRLAPDVHVVFLDRPQGNDPFLPWRIARVARRLRTEVVHSHSWGVFLEAAGAAWLAGCRAVHTVHGPYLEYGDTWSQRLRARGRRVLEGLAARYVGTFACVSEPLREAFVATGLPGSAIVVHNGIPDVPAAPVEADTSRPVNLVSVGRLAEIKAYDVLLRAFARASQRMPRLRLTLVGDGPQRHELERLAERLCVGSSVRFVGFRENVAELLASQDLFVLSSRHEGISIAILEAMRAGLPVVATRVGGVPETVVDGVTGLLVTADDPVAFAEALETALANPAQLRAMGAAGRALQQRRFSIRRMRDDYLSLYAPARVPKLALPDRPLRILYHHRTQGRGAEGVHIASIVRALERDGHQVTVVGPAGTDPLRDAGSAPVDKSAVSTRGVASIWKWVSRHAPGWVFEFAEIAYNLVAWRQLRRAWASGSYDLIYERYAFFMVAGGWFAARRRVPFVLEANEVNGLEERARRQWMPGVCAVFERQLLDRCDGVLTVSSYLRRLLLQRGVHPRRVRVVPNAVEARSARRTAPERQLLERYGLRGRVVVGFAGWFDHWDRLEMMLEALATLAPEYPDAVALLLGDGPVRERLQQRARDLKLDGRVVFAGAVPRSEMPAHMALFDIAALPHSNRFGSPVVLFEFMAQSLPVVAPALDPITDVLRDGVTGRLFTPGDLDEFTAALEALLASGAERRRLGVAASDQVLARHTWDHNAGEILDVLGAKPAEPSRMMRRAS